MITSKFKVGDKIRMKIGVKDLPYHSGRGEHGIISVDNERRGCEGKSCVVKDVHSSYVDLLLITTESIYFHQDWFEKDAPRYLTVREVEVFKEEE